MTAPRQRLSERELRMILARVAFVSQVRGDISTFQDEVLRNDFIQVLSDSNYLAMSPVDAAATAEQLLDVAEGELGLLVRKGPRELGFLHRLLQEQLAAEHISDRLTPAEMNALFEEHVGDPRWREVLLATMWRLSRPSELRDLTGVIRKCIDDSPTGLGAREMLAAVTFGPYGLPIPDIQQSAPEIIEVIENHPYGPHRARLLDSVLTGLEGVATGDIVRECLERWALLVQSPSSWLVWEIAQLPSDEELSQIVCKLLMLALRNQESSIAYESARAIAHRCSSIGSGSDKERDQLRTDLLHVLSDPPTGLAQAAALTALALGWRHDQLVVDILNEARGHKEASVRTVALSDAVGVLHHTLATGPAGPPMGNSDLSVVEREWLIARLQTPRLTDIHEGLLVAAASEASRGNDSVLEGLLDILESTSKRFTTFELIWPVTMKVWAEDDRVLKIVCDQLRSNEFSNLIWSMRTNGEQLLASAYPPGSSQNHRVAAAIEDHLQMFDMQSKETELFYLAGIDRGPVMKETLLKSLEDSPWPHWAAMALADYYDGDADVRAALASVLLGEPVRASMIANVTAKVLPHCETIPRLLQILRDLNGSMDSTLGRYDIVASALIQACQEQGVGLGQKMESIAAEALELLPTTPHPLRGDPRHDVAAFFYPTVASKAALAELATLDDRPIELYLRAFRNDIDQVQPFLAEASKILRSLPAYLRARVCQSLADRAVEPELVMHLTHRWADEVSRLNKSTASLAYHRALLKAKEEKAA